MDEAIASLDVESETFVQKALSHLINDRTVIMIVHRMRTIANASKLVVLEDGHIVEQGTPQQLLKQGSIYRRMVNLQNMSNEWKL